MFIEERYLKILDLIKQKTRISYSELAKTLFISESTIRRDIRAMADKGLIAKIHGGASIIESKTQESSVYIRENKNQSEKKRISNLVTPLLKDGISIFLDASTTSSNLIPLLNQFNSITVVTNGIDTALQLLNKTNIQVFLAGGEILRKTNATCGYDVINYINNLTCDFLFFSCKGLSEDGRITEANINTKEVKLAMIRNAKKKVLLLDNSKFYKNFMLTTCTLKEIDYLITDKKPNDDIIKLCKEDNVKLIF